MRHQIRGARKRLAPSVDVESACPHEYNEEEGLRLEIDCSSCPGAQDLNNNKCVCGVLNIISRGAVPDCVVLKRYVHKRYRMSNNSWICGVAKELATLNRTIGSPDQPSDKKCRTCNASKERVARLMKHALLENPRGYLESKSVLVQGLTSNLDSVTCTERAKCTMEVLSITTSIDRGE